MHIGKSENFNSNQPLTSGTQATVKIPVPQPSFQINTDSLKWVDKLGSLTGKYITSSIKSGKLFNINGLGTNSFGIPAFSAQGRIQRPVLNFTLDNNHNLNLTSIDMQSSTGNLHRWASAPDTVNSVTPPIRPASPDVVADTPPPLPQRPANWVTQSSVRMELSNTNQAKMNVQTMGSMRADNVSVRQQNAPKRGSTSNMTASPSASFAQRAGVQSKATAQPAPPLPPRPNVQTQQVPEARASRISPASEIAENVPGPSLDEMEQFLTGPSLSNSRTVPLARPGIQRREARQPAPPLPPRPNVQTQQVSEARASRISPASEIAENVPGPSLDEMEQFLTGPPLPPKIRHAASFPTLSASDMNRMNVPGSLRPGPGRRRQSDFIPRPNQVSEARASQTSPTSGNAENVPGPSLDEMEQFLTGPPLPPKIRHAASFPTLSASDMDRMNMPGSLRPGPGRRRQSDFINKDFSTTVPDSLRPGRTKPLSSPASSIEVQSQLMAASLLASQHSTHVNPSNSSQKIFTNVQSMQNVYKGEETGIIFGTKVKYLNAQERAAYKATIKDGKVYDSAGRLFDTRQASTAFALNKGRAIFVMDASGSMYISNEQTRGKFHHSSFFSGGPVAAAGDVRIENGVMTAISRKSGHYRPTESQLNQAVNHLKKQGISGVFIDEDLS